MFKIIVCELATLAEASKESPAATAGAALEAGIVRNISLGWQSRARRPPVKEDRMPYSPQHKQQTRERILESARRLFNTKGYAEVSIEEVMTHAGLTHGGFYRHFASKDELFAEAVRHFICRKPPETWQVHQSAFAASKSRAQRMVDAYFSRDHFDDRESCCPLLTAASEVARSGTAVKAAYREVAEKAVGILEAHFDEPEGRERALAVLALCVGGMVLARGVDDPSLADAFRDAAHKHALRTGGWNGA
jgi:AcrR family transcriptional regulator